MNVWEVEEEVEDLRLNRGTFRQAYRYLANHGETILGRDQAISLENSAATEGNYRIAEAAKTVADLWDLTE